LGRKRSMASQFREILEFFEDIGVFDVILPFLLAFTIVFAILEKTKVLGTEEHGGKHYTKKNLNAIVAFVIAFLVIASSRLVEIITNVSANAVVLLFLSVLFLLLVGSFHKEGEPIFLEGGWKQVFMGIMFLGIGGIFLNEIETDDGRTWLEAIGDYLGGNTSDTVIGSAILLIVVVGFMFYILQEPEKGKPSGGGH
jgi:hypothetical membrane protein